VAVHYRSCAAAAVQTVAALHEAGGQAMAFAADLSVQAECEALVLLNHGCSMIATMIFSRPPRLGKCSISISKAKLQRRLTCSQVKLCRS